jgi:hypothetical protein
LLRLVLTSLGLVGFLTLGLMAAASRPPSETTRGTGVTDSSGHALLRAAAAGDNHHWSVDLALRSAAEGTYALVFSPGIERPAEPVAPIALDDAALQCAVAHAKGCVLGAGREVVATTSIGPGGAGTLRAAFDSGIGGWFELVRIDRSAAREASFELTVTSEALSQDEAPHRFAIEQMGPIVALPTGPS